MISEKEAGKECPQCRRAWKVQQSPFSNNKFIHCIHCKESAEKILKKHEMKGKVAEAFKKPGTEYDVLLKQYELFLDGWDNDIFYVIRLNGTKVKLSKSLQEGKEVYLLKGMIIMDNKSHYTIPEDAWYKL